MSIAPARWPRRTFVAVAVVLGLLLAAIALRTLALHRLASALQQVLGPRGSYASMHVAVSGLELQGVRIAGDRGGQAPWPVADELRVDTLLLVPEWRTWFPWHGDAARHLRDVQVHGGYLAVLRSADGKLHVLPSLLHRQADDQQSRNREATLIDRLSVDGVAIDYVDSHVRPVQHRVRIEAIHGSAGPQRLPQADAAMRIDLQGTAKGPKRDGQIALSGMLTPKTRDADLNFSVVGADLTALQPYLVAVGKGGVRAGTLDLSMHARVADRRVVAPGSLVIAGLRIGTDDEGMLSRLADMPRRVALASMSDHDRIALRFTLQGPLSAPKFTLDEDAPTRAATGVARVLGVTIGDLVEGVGNVAGNLFK